MWTLAEVLPSQGVRTQHLQRQPQHCTGRGCRRQSRPSPPVQVGRCCASYSVVARARAEHRCPYAHPPTGHLGVHATSNACSRMRDIAIGCHWARVPFAAQKYNCFDACELCGAHRRCDDSSISGPRRSFGVHQNWLRTEPTTFTGLSAVVAEATRARVRRHEPAPCAPA
jgi:hypothetical protein